MNEVTTTALLDGQPFIRGFKPHEVEQLAALAKAQHFARGEIIHREGEECQDFYLIVSGRVVLEIVPPTGPFPVDTVEAGDEFGWSAILMGHGRFFQARALQDTDVLAFDGAQLRSLCESDTGFGYRLMQRLVGLAAERLQATRLLLMDAHWPVARRAGA